MKFINFIKPLPNKRYNEIKTWFRVSLALVLALIIALTIIQISKNQTRKKTTQKKESILIQSIANKKQENVDGKISEEKKILQQKIQSINNIKKSTATAYKTLESIFKISNKQNVQVKSVTKNSDNVFEIHGQSEKTKNVMSFITKLSGLSETTSAKLVNLHTTRDTYSYTVKLYCREK